MLKLNTNKGSFPLSIWAAYIRMGKFEKKVFRRYATVIATDEESEKTIVFLSNNTPTSTYLILRGKIESLPNTLTRSVVSLITYYKNQITQKEHDQITELILKDDNH